MARSRTALVRPTVRVFSSWIEPSEYMPIRVVRLGSPRSPNEGPRLGTVRRPPRGVPKTEYAARDLYDVWLPALAPSESLLKAFHGSTDAKDWRRFAMRYHAEMKQPEASRLLDLLAALSNQANFSVGCYCADPARCHRTLLGNLLATRGAHMVAGDDGVTTALRPR